MFGKIRSEFQYIYKKGLLKQEFQCLERYDIIMAMNMKKELNSNVLKDRARIIMHAKIRSKLQFL